MARWLLDQVRQTEDALLARDPAATRVAGPLKAAREALASAVDYDAGQRGRQDQRRVRRGRAHLMLAGTTLAGWQMARALLASLDLKQEDPGSTPPRSPRRRHALHKLTRRRGWPPWCSARAVRSTALTGTAQAGRDHGRPA